MKYHVSSRWGVRFDVRFNISKTAANTDLDATPAVTRLTPQGRGALGGSPSIQFSNNSTDPLTFQGVTAVASSSLTGRALSGHRTFAGTGAAAHGNVTVGLYWRF
jgi:lysozyme family protein